MADPNTLVAGDLIRSARDEHPSFDARRHPDPVLLRALSRKQKSLVSKVIRSNSEAFVTDLETTFPLADFDAGITLPDIKYPARAEVQDAQGNKRDVDIIAWELANNYTMGAYIRNGVLYLTGIAQDWVSWALIRLYYMPEVEALTKLTGATGTLVLPNSAEPCLVSYLAYFMAKRGHVDKDLEQPSKREFYESWKGTEEEFLDEMDMVTQAVVSRVQERF